MKNLTPLFTDLLDFNCEDMVQCFYSLTKLELDIYCALLKMDEVGIDGTVLKIQEYMGRKEKTMINRSLKKLFEQGLVTRQTKTVNSEKVSPEKPKRGYFYTYNPLPLDLLVDELHLRLEKWYQVANTQISKIKDQFEQRLASSHPPVMKAV